MPRTINAQAIVYTMIDPEKEDYKQVRRMNNVALEADDGQLLAIGSAFASLYPGTQLHSTVLQQQTELNA